MNNQLDRIKLYKQRTFIEKIRATFLLLIISWRPLLKYMLYLILPVCIIQAFCIGTLDDTSKALKAADYANGMQLVSDFLTSKAPKYIVLIFISLIGMKLLTALIYTLMRCYNELQDGEEITRDKIHPLLMRNIKRMVRLILFSLGVCLILTLILALLAKLTPYTLIVTMPGLLICFIPLCLFIPTYLFEDIPVYTAFFRSFRMGFHTWLGTLILLLITSFIALAITAVIGSPFLSITNLQKLHDHCVSIENASIGHRIIVYIFCLVFLFVSCVVRCFRYVSMG